MKLSDVKTDDDWDRYLDEKSYESHLEVSHGMELGDCVDENGEEVEPELWYWRGVSEEMNDGIEEDEY